MAIKWQEPRKWLLQPVDILPLVVLRVGFGLLMLASTLRFIHNGWVKDLYITPELHFTYWGFGWVRPLPAAGMYAVFWLMALLSLCIALGWHYRLSMAAFFLAFTYVELLDKAYYLNHYYFVSLFSLLLIFLPLHRKFSLDAKRNPSVRADFVPAWTIRIIQVQLALVYFYAGVAKINPDWMLHGLPLTLWLPSKVDFPLIGPWFDHHWVALLMSWCGAFFDLTIPFWLLGRRTRPFAYLVVIGFHLLTGFLFPIGMFPYIMIVVTLIFFDEQDYERVFPRQEVSETPLPHFRFPSRPLMGALAVFFVIQVLFPLRHWLYPGNVLWTEEGFRFSWRVMLVEKTGMATFNVEDQATGDWWIVFPSQYLTPQQEKQMSFQPDMILQFAHFLEDEYQAQGYEDVRVTVDSYVSLNGRSSQRLIHADVDLTEVENTPLPKPWLTRLEH
jgi:hypothetical protein